MLMSCFVFLYLSMEYEYNGATVAFLALYEHEHILVMLRKSM